MNLRLNRHSFPGPTGNLGTSSPKVPAGHNPGPTVAPDPADSDPKLYPGMLNTEAEIAKVEK